MPAFVHPALLAGMALVGIPVLIHLINMLRHRRVQWAAMEFLLQSQKKNRTWIMMKQLLLLLLRMLAVATVVLIVARPMLQNRFGEFFGGSQTHHIMLLDDSFSMSDRSNGGSAFDDGARVVRQLGTKLSRNRQLQKFTLVRFSRCGAVAGKPAEADLQSEPVDTDFPTRLGKVLDADDFTVSQTAAGPIPAIENIEQLLGDPGSENRIVYILTDFRRRQWDEAEDLQAKLAKLDEADVEIRLINCTNSISPNLAITSLAPVEGIRAAGVPLQMEVAVKNFGTAPARNVSVLLQEDGKARPAVMISEVAPGEEFSKRFSVRFSTPGNHRVTAALEGDAIAADNKRFFSIDLPPVVTALLIDGDPQQEDARRLNMVLSSGGTVRTGIQPRIESPVFLGLNPLDNYQAIFLLNVDRLDRLAIEALEKYIAAGGGVGVFLGPRSRGKFITDECYREGKGFFPVPLAAPEELLVDRLQKVADIEVADHPIFRYLSGQRNNYLSEINVQQYFAVADDWRPSPESNVSVIANLRNGAPLALENKFGKGRVLTFLTTAAPAWNNWSRGNPSFPVVILEMQTFLAQRQTEDVSRQVGQPLELRLDQTVYGPRINFSKPNEADSPTAPVDAVADDQGMLESSLVDTDLSGMYSAKLALSAGGTETRHYAFNVDAEEGDTAALDGPKLATRLRGIDYQYEQASDFVFDENELAGYDLSEALLYLLIIMLVGEQILAYSAGYHPPSIVGRRAKGGVR